MRLLSTFSKRRTAGRISSLAASQHPVLSARGGRILWLTTVERFLLARTPDPPMARDIHPVGPPVAILRISGIKGLP